MRAEDVPDEWTTEALVTHYDGGEHISDFGAEEIAEMRAILAAVIPLIRAQVADEIAARFAQERADLADAEPITIEGLHRQTRGINTLDRVIATIKHIARGDQ